MALGGLFRREAKAADGSTLLPAGTPEELGGALGGSLTAAGTIVDLAMPSSWQFFTLGDRRWQWEAWRHYDICGELRFISNWKANAVSRCRLYGAVIDENGIPGDEADDEMVRAVADTIMGKTPAERAENMRMLALSVDLVGEVFPVAEGGDGGPDTDRWYVASTSEVYRRGSDVMVRRPGLEANAVGPRRLVPGKDTLGRIWSPHPRRYAAADAATRAALPKLRELEQATKQVFASIDSRLASAGILLLPESADLPQVAGQPPRQIDLQTHLTRVMQISLQDPASAAARVPIVIKVPDEAVDKIKMVQLDFPITDQVLKIREAAVTGLARSLDTPPEVLTGTGDVSHWSAWAVEESSIKLHIEPLLGRIADGLNRIFFQPLLKAAGVKDPEHYTLWFDVTALAIRPNRSDQANQLGDKGLLSDKAVRQANGFEETDAPSKGERVRKLLEKVLLAQPLFAADPVVAKYLGLPAGIQNPMGAGGAGMPGAPPALPGGVDPNDPNADPEALINALENGTVTPEDAGGVNGPPAMDTGAPPPNTRTASGAPANPALLVAADAQVRRALEVAGGRIVPGPGRDRYPECPRSELHTRVIPTADKIPSLLAGAWQGLRSSVALALGGPSDGTALALEHDLGQYATALLEKGHPHDPDLLRGFLGMKGYPV